MLRLLSMLAIVEKERGVVEGQEDYCAFFINLLFMHIIIIIIIIKEPEH